MATAVGDAPLSAIGSRATGERCIGSSLTTSSGFLRGRPRGLGADMTTAPVLRGVGAIFGDVTVVFVGFVAAFGGVTAAFGGVAAAFGGVAAAFGCVAAALGGVVAAFGGGGVGFGRASMVSRRRRCRSDS